MNAKKGKKEVAKLRELRGVDYTYKTFINEGFKVKEFSYRRRIIFKLHIDINIQKIEEAIEDIFEFAERYWSKKIKDLFTINSTPNDISNKMKVLVSEKCFPKIENLREGSMDGIIDFLESSATQFRLNKYAQIKSLDLTRTILKDLNFKYGVAIIEIDPDGLIIIN